MKAESLIPAPVTTNAAGDRLPYWTRTYPRSAAYEAAVRPELPAGWELYSVLTERAPTPEIATAWAALASKDFGATREDGRAHVFGIRELDGTPKHLRACVPSQRFGIDPRDKVFGADDLAAACRWCDEQLAARGAS